MTKEHEIPVGSRLYYGSTAQLKRRIENIASELLYKKDYEEIVTPSFSYSHFQSIDNENSLIKLSDIDNKNLALRADSTLDVVRLITSRIGRSTEHKKWFYIQPIFKYPSSEQYQIGIEEINSINIVDKIINIIDILAKFDIKPKIQLTNIIIPNIVSKELNISLEDLISTNLEVLMNNKSEWLKRLIYVQNASEVKEIINIVPENIKIELKKLLEIFNAIDYDNIVISPLYYAKMKYYDSIFFRAFCDNNVIAQGGIYTDNGVHSTGAAIYTDNLIEEII